jgi:hypothetical protein
MVRTTTGPAEKSTTKQDTTQPKPTADDKKFEKLADLDDETWDRVETLARSQGTTPSEVIRRAIVQTFGETQTATAFNSGTEA